TDKSIDRYFLSAIVESSQDSIITVDFDMKISSWNRAAEALYGYTAREAIGKPLTTLTRSEDLQMVTDYIEKVKNSKRVEIFETERVGKNKKQMTLEVMLSPFKDTNGKVVGVSTIARDLSERKVAERAKRDREL